MTDVKIGVQLTEYAVAENGGNISLCVQIFEGCLERDVVIEYATFDATAQSTYVLYQSSLILVCCIHTYILHSSVCNCNTYSSQAFYHVTTTERITSQNMLFMLMQATIIIIIIMNVMTFLHIDESDYGSISCELTFEASFGDLSGVGDSECVDVVIVNNDIKEYDESFVFAICSGGDDDVEICEREANVLIDDEDSKSAKFIFNITDDFMFNMLLTAIIK